MRDGVAFAAGTYRSKGLWLRESAVMDLHTDPGLQLSLVELRGARRKAPMPSRPTRSAKARTVGALAHPGANAAKRSGAEEPKPSSIAITPVSVAV